MKAHLWGQSLFERMGAWLKTGFPERQIVIRSETTRVHYLRLGRTTQIVLTLVLMVTGSWFSYTTAGYLLNKSIIDGKNQRILSVQRAYSTLLNDVSEYQQKFLAITRDLEENHTLMLDLVAQNTALQKDLSTVEDKLRTTEGEREQAFTARERLKSDLNGVQQDLHALAGRNFLLQDNLDTVEADLQRALEERNAALIQGERMRRQVGQLEKRLSHLQVTQLDTVQQMIDRTGESIGGLERVLQLAGLSIGDILPTAQAGGQGGPFVEEAVSATGDALGERLSQLETRLDRLALLQARMQQLPLSPPLITYYVTSSFGKRRDPVNRKWSMHYGLDLGGPRHSSIYTTAPGVVTFAGWKGNYGKLVEVDHGDGIRTRYGHLAKILVEKGDEVDFYDKIALLGNTGRSTGPHIHYEVVINDKPMDPMKFIVAGRHVFQE